MELSRARPVDAPAANLFTTHARRFTILSWLAIGVSYVHQAASLLLFSGAGWLDVAAGLGMTAIVDLALWMLGEYLYEARRAGRKAGWALLAFLIAIAVSIGLNFVYLYTHRPKDAVLTEWVSTPVAAVFAVFVPLLIGVSGLIRADLARWQMDADGQAVSLAALEQQARHATDEARQLRATNERLTAAHASATDEARQARADATEQARQLESLRASATANHATTTAEARQATEQARAFEQQARQATADATAATARARDLEQQARQATDEARQLRAQLEQATEQARQAVALPTRTTVAARLKQALNDGATLAALARETGWKESTLRDMVAAA